MLALAVLSAGLVACNGGGKAEDKEKVSAVRGSACGYYVKVGLFGGPQNVRGCDQPPGAPATGGAPTVKLPATGSPTPLTAEDLDGGAAQYGPAVISGGRWPCAETGDRNCPAAAPATGPMKVSTEGTLEGTVTSSAHITLHPTPRPVNCYSGYGPNCYSVGGFGPSPVEGDELHVTCTSSAQGTTGGVTFKNAFHAKSTTSDGSPKDMEPLPENPPPNYTRDGVITNVGDVFTAIYNEQIVNEDGSLTVNAVHMYLFGPTAIGEVVKGQATCGRVPAKPAKDTQPPACGTLVVAPISPEDPTPKTPRTELVGVFDNRGLQAIENVKVTNGTVQIGNPSGQEYLKFTPGQTGPLAMTATRTPEAEAANLPLSWEFDALDKAGNKIHCPTSRAPEPTTPPPTAAEPSTTTSATTA